MNKLLFLNSSLPFNFLLGSNEITFIMDIETLYIKSTKNKCGGELLFIIEGQRQEAIEIWESIETFCL